MTYLPAVAGWNHVLQLFMPANGATHARHNTQLANLTSTYITELPLAFQYSPQRFWHVFLDHDSDDHGDHIYDQGREYLAA